VSSVSLRGITNKDPIMEIIPNKISGFDIPIKFDSRKMDGANILPIVPPADINPTASDLTTVGNNSEIYVYIIA
jgi:hypothetical protein